jgi:hypothetical protein
MFGIVFFMDSAMKVGKLAQKLKEDTHKVQYKHH